MTETALAAPPADLVADGADGGGRVLLEGVSKLYGKNWAVKSLDLEIAAGEFISLLGPSGCGKTTTLRMIGGFELPDEGEVTIGGTAMGSTPPYRRPVNTVFQSYALFPHMSVAKNVAYGLRYAKVPKSEVPERVTEALGMVRMKHLASRMPAQLSGGQQQRIALARALVNRPAVLLLDEPMSALDRKLREEMQIELKLLQQQLGTTFVFVTHDQEEAMTMSDRIAVMNGGRIEQIGSPADVYDRPASAYVAGFIGQQNFFEGTVSSVAPLTVAVPDGAIASSRPSTAAAGAAATVAVRPESVSIAEGEASEGEANAVTATLMSVSRLGSYLQVVTITPGGQKVMARIPWGVTIPTAIGTRVVCRWPADAPMVYPA
ncbi:ABC transporter ATP-binding protein [Amnibacterium kyonggiense]|uniref:Spermidine/putrescine import ATP-binding protein PotA n=1 Tax=Amnibacterium kyonggiense TaxID=595671 RepID=A0A4V3EB96_9MICO|nr:ABC transporter ATP-binding protein [Amnibacterium kyonggiense]TDS80874.1 spermidine/putrescine transport system ATP-binding protein [Amnibacterium kyonggiense]